MFEFPNLKGVDLIAVDTETRDPRLLTHGPGGHRDDGHVAGISLAWERNGAMESCYFPVGHGDGPNLDSVPVKRFLQDLFDGKMAADLARVTGLETPATVWANAAYDLEWLRHFGVRVPGPKYDVQIAEPLLDENRQSYRLNALAELHLGENKLSNEVVQLAVQRFGCKESEAMGAIWKLRGDEVAPYARVDAELTLRVWMKQRTLLAEAKLMDVFLMEARLIDVLHEMRWKGFRVNEEAARSMHARLSDRSNTIMDRLELASGKVGFSVWSADDIMQAAEKLGLAKDTLRTSQGTPSFPSAWLEKQTAPLFKDVLAYRKIDKVCNTFLSAILDRAHKGRIHCQYHQVRGDRGGTVSGRLSSSGPNMQQIPARDEEMSRLVRGLFLPEEGCVLASFDSANIEPRIIVHYANALHLPRAGAFVDQWHKDPRTNYHKWTAELTGLEYKLAKAMNLGLAFGMGLAKMADTLGLTKEETKPLWDQYHEKMPFVRALTRACQEAAENRGWVKTISGRRRRFNLYGPRQYKEGMKPLPYEAAVKEYGPHVVRWFTYRAANAVVQGTAADILKRAMVKLFEVSPLYVPHASVHDELIFSLPRDYNQDVKKIGGIMSTETPLCVPTPVDVAVGPTWGELKELN